MSKNTNRSQPKAFDELLFPYLNIRPIFPDAKALEEALAHLEKAQEERALVIVGALLIEKAIDQLLSAFVQGYEDRDFSFFQKLKLARTIHICPMELLDSVDIVREVRNAFAHDLSVSNLSNVLKKKRNLTKDLRQHIRKYVKIDNGYEIVGFRFLVSILVEQFYYYQLQAWLINEFIRSDDLLPALQSFCHTHDIDLNRLAKK